jgi:hypothetical protein
MKGMAWASAIGFLSTAASAASVPKDAVPFTAAEVRTHVSGKTVTSGREFDFFDPSGTVTGVYGPYGAEAIGRGNWTIQDNELCWSIVWKSRQGSRNETWCRKFHNTSFGAMVEDSRNEPGMALSVYPISGFVLLPGDRVTAKYEKFQKILGSR